MDAERGRPRRLANATPWLAPRERLIVALDLPDRAAALDLVARLGDAVRFYKLGMELLTSGDYFRLVGELAERGKRVFADLKFFDVPATVARAVRGLARFPVDFVTVHGNDGMLRAAAEAKGPLKVLAVTALTSLDQADLAALGFDCDPERLVLSRARAALAAGCDGIVSSGLEAAAVRAECGDSLILVCPGIRPVANVDDQKRTVDLATAFAGGADYVVIGRPVRDAPDPRAAVLALIREAEIFFSSNQ
ncbi:MAG: orotidine-5'-phosphate decarboxylase [Xanthomonadales bacterium]|nr:orotidine-5'-phosphate decarboxylase [Xanthomonadales bacterium]